MPGSARAGAAARDEPRRQTNWSAPPPGHTGHASRPDPPYDLVKEFVVAGAVVGVITVLLAAVFSSPDRKAITLATWAEAAPNDVVATATGDLAGTTTSAACGAPYNPASAGQKLGPLPRQRWAASASGSTAPTTWSSPLEHGHR
jgi:hypothetical protein